LINGQHGVTPDMAIRLEQAFGGAADVWMRMQANYDLAKVRAAGAINLQKLTRKAS
jgi:addiction module HigA family antidote